MLKRIKIADLALVADVDLEFGEGLVVLTGETGAGKSIVVTALSLALGERADREYVRHGADKGIIEAVFDVSRMTPDYRKEFAELVSDNQLYVFREIARDGNSKVRINGRPATLAQLRAATAPIAEILGQHANQMLMNEENHLDFLDNFAALGDLRRLVADCFHRWKKSAGELAGIKARRDQLAKERELLLFQKNEIAKAKIRVGEEEELNEEKKILDSARTLMASAATIKELIEGEENSLSTLLVLAQKELDRMARIDRHLETRASELAGMGYQLDDLRAGIEQYASSIQDDPRRIEEINLRLDEIYNLKKKYGGSEEAILDSLEAISRKQAEGPPDIDGYIDDLTRQTEKEREGYAQHAHSLSDTRKKAADYLQKLVVKELKELAIDNGGFELEFVYEDDPDGVIIDQRAVKPSPRGLEQARILFSANPGEPLKSLVKTASGGEISRVLLALKSAEKKNNKLRHSLLVFDEVDSGIGGRTAVEVGRKLKRLSADSQLLVVTHLHQIAREADDHYLAEKTGGRGRRVTIDVRKLEPAEIETELRRMVALPER
ncbi:MAG: DNA repair protein RecN [Candidatus Zixiibacteriota bacterium]|nr:MAG: DNA repair protein RecN [candidate division Zixibacteria bacterium]